MMIATGKLNDAGLSVLREKLEKLNKRAVRNGLEELTIRVTGIEWIKTTDPSGLDRTIRINCVEVDGCVPRIDGWTVAARIEFTEAGNLVHCSPHIGNLDCRYRTVGNICEHCNTKRRRNDIIVIRHNDGREIVVGRNCLADYIRTGDAEALIEYAGWLGNIEHTIRDLESDYYGGRGESTESVETVLRAASICIRKLGWVSGREAYNDISGDTNSTKNDVCSLLFPPINSRAHAEWKKWVKHNDLNVCDHDKDLAGKALAWAQSVEPGESDYLANLKVLAQLDRVTSDKFGYIVSIIPAYNKDVERETERAERAARAAKKGSKEFFGSPKIRSKGVKATCVGLNSFDGQYGVTTLVRFEHRIDSDSYAPLAWFASGDKTESFEVGKDYTFDATVKDHNDHEKYGKQTRINRVTVK